MMRKLFAALAAIFVAVTACEAPTEAAPGYRTPNFSINSVKAMEDQEALTFTIVKGSPSEAQSVLSYQTRDGTALSSADYAATSGTIVFGPREMSKTFTVPIVNDSDLEGTEYFTVRIRGVQNARIYRGTGEGSILNDDSATPPPAPTTQTCWNGTVIPIGQACPVQTQTCPDGTVIPVTQTCPVPVPPATQTCPDGSVILATATCPPPVNPTPQTQTCWDGSVIPVTSTCPPAPPPPPTTKTCWDGSVIPIANSCPAQPAPPPSSPGGYVLSPNGLLGATPIASNFDINLGLSGTIGTNLPKSAAPDVVGAFRFICTPGQIDYIDPIVNPGTASHHLHQFFGNTIVTRTSTYDSLRASGGSTCSRVGDIYSPTAIALNRSAYWMPAMLNGKGSVVKPDHLTVYYKRLPSTDPRCDRDLSAKAIGDCVDLPHGLRFIFGRDMTDLSKPPTGGFNFRCNNDVTTKTFKTMKEAIDFCFATPSVKRRLGVAGNAPQCWDGQHLDTPDHRSHVGYPSYGSWGYLKCPSTHPYAIPHFELVAWFTMDALKADMDLWTLSSDEMTGEAPGSTFHADFWMAWDPTVHGVWHGHCINKMLNCSAGILGDGRKLIGAEVLPPPNPRLVPIPPRPVN